MKRFYAQRLGSKTSELKSSHVSFVSHPKDIVAIIVEAATTAPATAPATAGTAK